MRYMLLLLLFLLPMSLCADEIGFFYVLADSPSTLSAFNKNIKTGAGKSHRRSVNGTKALFKDIDYTFDALVKLRYQGNKILSSKEAKALMDTPEWSGAIEESGGN